jgi:small neutral amino acid transporter SnatA (MarC family)
MHSDAGAWVEAGLLILIFVVVVPSIAAAIGYAAWKGKPKNFDREMYWMAFVTAIAVSLFLMVFAQRMHADVRTWQYLAQVMCFGSGAILFGVAGGCMIGIFTYRRGARNQVPPEN